MSAVEAAGRIQQIQSKIDALQPSGTPTGAADFDAAMDEAASATGTNGTSGTSVAGGSGATLPSGVTGQDIVNDAQKYLGIPYVFGGQSGSGMDCSGLVRQVLGDLGMSTGHSVATQAQLGTSVPSLAQAQPGDLIIEKGNAHVQIYAGNGQIIEAPKPGENVVQRAEWLDPSQIQTIRRVTTPAQDADDGTGGADLSALLAASGLQQQAVAQLTQLLGSDASAGSSSPNGGADASGLSPATLAQAFSLGAMQTALDSFSGSSDSSGSQSDSSTGNEQLSALISSLNGAGGTAQAFQSTAATAPVPAATPQQVAALPQQLQGPIAGLAQLGDGDHSVTVKIAPEALGPVTINAHIAGGRLDIQLSAPNGSGHDALNGMLSDLRRDLASNGITANLSLAAGSGDQSGQNGQQSSQQQAILDLLSQGQAFGQGSGQSGSGQQLLSALGLSGGSGGTSSGPDASSILTALAPLLNTDNGLDVLA